MATRKKQVRKQRNQKSKNKKLLNKIAWAVVIVAVALSIVFFAIRNTSINTGFIKNIELGFTKEIPVYENGENIQVSHLMNLDNPRGRNNGGYAQLGLIFYYIDDVYVGGQQLGVGNSGNPRTSEAKFNSPEMLLTKLDNGEHTITAKYKIALGGDTCSSGSPVNCGQRLPELANCVTGDKFYSTERFPDTYWNFMQKIPCEYIEGKSATGVLFPSGDDWSGKVSMDYNFELSKKFVIQNAVEEEPPIICTDGQERCDMQELDVCENNKYVSQGLVDGKCGYTKYVKTQPYEPTEPDNPDTPKTPDTPIVEPTDYTKIMAGLGAGLVVLAIVGVIRSKSKGKRRKR